MCAQRGSKVSVMIRGTSFLEILMYLLGETQTRTSPQSEGLSFLKGLALPGKDGLGPCKSKANVSTHSAEEGCL